MSDKPTSDLDERIEAGRREARRQVAEERRDITQQAIDRGIQDELAEERVESEDLAERVEAAVARENSAEAKARARRETLPIILLLIMLFLILYLIAAATGHYNIIQFFGGQNTPSQLNPALPGGSLSQSLTGLTGTYPGNVGAPGSVPIPEYDIAQIFRDYYYRNGGLPIFGYPISDQMQVNGRTVQWFQRARLEYWPEQGYAGTPYEIQGGRVGVEYTGNRAFPQQAPFISTPTNHYFAETGYGVRGAFLQFWQQHGGLAIFGYPISNEVQETLDDGKVYTVQYFERARMEIHPELANTPFTTQLGLIGTALHMQNDEPNITAAPTPTLVPLPTPLPAQP
ncbi:MAG TPA: hypothetical protein VFT66_19815 [Roseiflexaceae bacterium]|jgi:hypothetical protein|nr:hypothetical protein [Roseiflexaceae bacterium]